MKNILTIVIILCIGLMLMGCVSFALSLPGNIGNYFWSYEQGMIEHMKKFDMVITDTRSYSKQEIKQLKDKGIVVIGYISIGESAGLEKGDGMGPGGFASWYFDANNDNQPDKNPNWYSYYTNPANKLWVQRILETETKAILDKGADGFFLDTVDTAEVFPQARKDMVNLIKKMREKYPNKIIIQNWGFCIIDSTAPFINSVMWESWYPNPGNPWFEQWQNKMKELKAKYGIDIITLGYGEVYNNLEEYYKESQRLGFIPFISSNQRIKEIVDFFSARRMGLKPSASREYLTALITTNGPGLVVLSGPMGTKEGWSKIKKYGGRVYREVRGVKAGVEVTIPDKDKDTLVTICYLDDHQGKKLGISYYQWDTKKGKVVRTSTGIRKNGTHSFKEYRFIISKLAYRDTNPKKEGMQVVVTLGGLDKVDGIRSITISQ